MLKLTFGQFGMYNDSVNTAGCTILYNEEFGLWPRHFYYLHILLWLSDFGGAGGFEFQLFVF